MARGSRQLRILELISKRDIDTQEELSRLLQAENFNVTQATVSRDIKDLGLIKVTVNGKQKYVKEKTDSNVGSKIVTMFKNAVLSIDYALNIVVIKTISGGASSAGSMIDKLSNPDILGCVAGDDTVLAVTKNEQVAASVVDVLNEIIC